MPEPATTRIQMEASAHYRTFVAVNSKAAREYRRGSEANWNIQCNLGNFGSETSPSAAEQFGARQPPECVAADELI